MNGEKLRKEPAWVNVAINLFLLSIPVTLIIVIIYVIIYLQGGISNRSEKMAM